MEVSEQSLTSTHQGSVNAVQKPYETPEISPKIVTEVEPKVEQKVDPRELAANQQPPVDNKQGDDLQATQTFKNQERGQEQKQTTAQAATQPIVDPILAGYEDYQHISNQTAEQEHELLSQQAFYQDMAESQGFDPSSEFQQGAAHFPEQSLGHIEPPPQEPSVVAQMPQSNSALNSTSELENPVMAILANRGLPTNLANVASSVQTAEIEKLESNSSAQEPQQSQEQVPVEKVIEEKLEELPDLKPIEHDEVKFAHEVDEWARMIEVSDLAGLGRQLARNGEVKIDGNQIELTVKQEFAHLLNERSEAELTDVVSRLSPASNFVINKSEITQASPADIQKNINVNRQERAEQSIAEDGFVQTLLNEFGGKIIPGTINPVS
ncbi:DNA polymerase III subunit gamma/tau C-terminal domain-containing protein [Psychrosphaera algicola]|uniref:DNA polymerase III subunit gamma/tau C-terminal domain-containing protein n=1 Tax=Psychrosphaera algicola TaxID=3023714 RepID=A0ABT5FIK8_9GAMM|nr:DNA polymerase III subunit gamma/tau C-terminal domain-containing protein [Psychrosphaera sp. G1-22]MDC2891021.1 DNA polymerase III subunit gamma/tau C-terminal domain-containing protein [Psychrosphaera sp. G1-22]